MKVLIVNGYSLDLIYDEWINGKSPAHYMFGKIELEKYHHIKVDIVPIGIWKNINRIGKVFKFANLDQELWMLFRMHRYDLVFATFGTGNTKLLSILKIFGLIRTPIVMLAHQNLYVPESDIFNIKKSILCSYDRILFFSRELMSKTIFDLNLSNSSKLENFQVVKWGPDHEFYRNRENSIKSSDSKFAICAGTTDRDFDLIIDVFTELGFPLEIYCTPETKPLPKDLPSHITINHNFIPYVDLLKRYKQARFILIPILNEKVVTGRTLGLTVLLDAIAIGKPVIMTHNKYVDLLDPENEGFGINIYNNSKSEWVSAIKDILNNYEKLDEMAEIGHNLFLNGYNSKSFAKELFTLFNELVKK